MSNKNYSKSTSKSGPNKSYSKRSAIPDDKERAYQFIENLFAEHVNELVPFVVDGDTYYGAVEGLAVFNWAAMATTINALDDGINSREYIATVLNKLCAYHAHELLSLIVPLLKKYCDVDVKYPLLHEVNYPAFHKRPIAKLTRTAGDAKMTASIIISAIGIMPEFTNGRDHPEDAFASLESAVKSKKIDAYSGDILEMCYKFYSELAKSLRQYEQAYGSFDRSFQTTILEGRRIVVNRSAKARCYNRCKQLLAFEDNYFHQVFSDEEATFDKMVHINAPCVFVGAQ